VTPLRVSDADGGSTEDKGQILQGLVDNVDPAVPSEYREQLWQLLTEFSDAFRSVKMISEVQALFDIQLTLVMQGPFGSRFDVSHLLIKSQSRHTSRRCLIRE
jgi:hypothetical protein